MAASEMEWVPGLMVRTKRLLVDVAWQTKSAQLFDLKSTLIIAEIEIEEKPPPCNSIRWGLKRDDRSDAMCWLIAAT